MLNSDVFLGRWGLILQILGLTKKSSGNTQKCLFLIWGTNLEDRNSSGHLSNLIIYFCLDIRGLVIHDLKVVSLTV